MCTLFIYKKNPNTRWPLLIAANRDEYINRPFHDPGFHWQNWPNIYAGKDLLKGGSWIGLNDNYVFAVILNRHNNNFKQYSSSRGDLVVKALKYKSAKDAVRNIKTLNYKNYNYFNLFISDIENSYWIKNDHNHFSVNKILEGYSILDNYDLNDKKSNKQFIYRKKLMNCKRPIPEKNFFKDWKKLLFSKVKYNNDENTAVYNYNKIKKYGTLSSSIVALPNKKNPNILPIWLYHEYNMKNKKFTNLRPFESK